MPYIPQFSAYVVFFLSGFWIWMIVDCLLDKRMQWKQKIVWLLVLIFFEPFGMFIYFFVALVGRLLTSKLKRPVDQGPYGIYERGYEGKTRYTGKNDVSYVEDNQKENNSYLYYEQPKSQYPE